MLRTARLLVPALTPLVLLLGGAAALADLEQRLSAATRSDADRARDAGRKPAAVVEFLGVAPGMTALDLIAAGGYYTEVLSLAVGPEGRVYAHNSAFSLRVRDGANDVAMRSRLAGGRLPNVQRVDAEIDALPIPDASVDVAITALNLHDVYNAGGEEAAVAFLQAVHAKLVPGGVLGIIDHVGVDGRDNAKLHRIEKQQVLAVVEKSGFLIEDESDLLANVADDHSQGVFTPGLRGQTDRFLLRLRKSRPPAASDQEG